jgi:hypothetical protein
MDLVELASAWVVVLCDTELAIYPPSKRVAVAAHKLFAAGEVRYRAPYFQTPFILQAGNALLRAHMSDSSARNCRKSAQFGRATLIATQYMLVLEKPTCLELLNLRIRTVRVTTTKRIACI